ncbi:hypothetical protein DFH08DRAFT_1044906 [Mycena albidolilacea]|uniref:Uncharacterized protein n=1 Tax=Mycena albidolilacea TaxID=1033008 RepID=A0AAD6Z826_9AGAR|nr:hypothetical protein DFH08DRAFT_1044906 [Mycena albidolilacea]
MKSIFHQLRSFRLGYTEERPYPWKWTTPIVLSAFVLISAFLAALNVPLSAYNIVQEFTYHPNDTLPAVALSSLVPSYTIVDAFDGLDEAKPVSSFSYYNNPLSEGCDVTNVTINFSITREVDISSWYPQYETLVGITCRVPTLFHLVWPGGPTINPGAGFSLYENIPDLMINDLGYIFSDWIGYDNTTWVNISMTAHACCRCDPAGSPETTTLLGPLCSSAPPQFMVTEAYFTFEGPDGILAPSGTVHPLMSTEALEKLAGQPGNVSTPDFTSAFQNIFQVLYHLVRVDLGVILDNQIYDSPQMYNLSIMPTNVPASWGSSSANESRAMTSNSTLMAQWRQRVAFYQNSDHVPTMDYLRPVPRLKPLGSAITSVFVSTFVMLSTLWTIFSLGAGALARCTAPARQQLSPPADSHETISGDSHSGWHMGTSSSFAFDKDPAPMHIRLEHLKDDMGRMKLDMGGMKHDMREMKHMMQLLLEKQGLMDDRLDHDLKEYDAAQRQTPPHAPAPHYRPAADINQHVRSARIAQRGRSCTRDPPSSPARISHTTGHRQHPASRYPSALHRIDTRPSTLHDTFPALRSATGHQPPQHPGTRRIHTLRTYTCASDASLLRREEWVCTTVSHSRTIPPAGTDANSETTVRHFEAVASHLVSIPASPPHLSSFPHVPLPPPPASLGMTPSLHVISPLPFSPPSNQNNSNMKKQKGDSPPPSPPLTRSTLFPTRIQLTCARTSASQVHTESKERREVTS